MSDSLVHPRSETIGDSVAMRHLRAEVALAARSEIPVFIVGETGVGKELVAHDLHHQSARRWLVVQVNVCAASESMFDAAMFGHRRGAFTGAVEDGRGFIAEADGGTLFLDETCSLSLEAEATLLRALESRRFRPLGGRADVASAFRLLTATNRSLRDEVTAGRFRVDIFYRLTGYEIEIPPLHEHRGDSLPLLLHVMESFDVARESPRQIAAEAWDGILRYEWPGNIRELRHVAWHAATRLVAAVRIETGNLARPVGVGQRSSARVATLDDATVDGETQSLVRTLLHHWDTSAVAREFGVTRKTIYARMKRMRVPTRRRPTPADGANAIAWPEVGMNARGSTAQTE